MIKQLLKKSYNKWLENRQRNLYVGDESKNMKNLQLSTLTNKEAMEVYNLWSPIVPQKYILYHQMFKTLRGFDARFVSDEYYYPVLLRALNPAASAATYEHKAYYMLYYNKIPQPRMFVNRIKGIWYDGNYSIITEKEALGILKACGQFIIKPTHDSCQGKNVKKISSDDKKLEQVIGAYGNDFITQEVLQQSEVTSRFNPASLNSFRLTTLNINGKVSLCTILFRCGQGDTPVDNGGAGGLMAGVTDQGALTDFAFDKNYQRFSETKMGVKFGGVIIPNMANIVEEVKLWHSKYMIHSGIVGWDIALDAKNNPVMIEVNLMYPGIQFEQLCIGKPLFGDRTQEVIDYFVKQQHN